MNKVTTSGVRGISGYVPKRGSAEDRVASSTKSIKELEFKLETAKRILAAAQREIEELTPEQSKSLDDHLEQRV